MVKITLVSLLHSLCTRFPVYPAASLTSLLDAHQGEVWLPARKGVDIALLRKHANGAHELASLDAGWCDFAASDSGDTPELDALANYDSEMMDNLQMYWHSPAKINSPITDNLLSCAARWWKRLMAASWPMPGTARSRLVLHRSWRGLGPVGISSASSKWRRPTGCASALARWRRSTW